MKVERDSSITMEDGTVLRADVYMPEEAGAKFPAILNMGPYGKGLRYQDGYSAQWKWLIEKHPEILKDSSGSFLTWETVDPERWTPWGYAIVRVDSRGAGRSSGILDPFSPRETRDLYNCIEWAGTRPWSDGNVGLCGISYYAINQWQVAGLKPPHLRAMIPWEGAADFYRDFTYHGGILSNVFAEVWFNAQVLSIQHGLGNNGPEDPWLHERAAGPETLSPEELIATRANWLCNIKQHKLVDNYYKSRSANFSRIVVPFLSASNWGGFGLHPRGNFEGFVESSSKEKWLEVHGGRHEENFYLPYALELQRRFFDHYLKGKDNGWEKQKRVMLSIRYIDRFETRYENEWPLARTKWTKLFLDSKNKSLSWNRTNNKATVKFSGFGEGVKFTTRPLEEPLEITGPLASRLFVSSSTIDADLFLTLLAYDPENNEVSFQGTLDPKTPLAQGWLRASHRGLDSKHSVTYRPYHSHKRVQKLHPRSIYRLDIEIWPTCIVLPPGYSIALVVQGKDYQRKDDEMKSDSKESKESFRGVPMRGSGPFLHNDPEDRSADIFGGVTTIHTGPANASFLLLPIIPRR